LASRRCSLDPRTPKPLHAGGFFACRTTVKALIDSHLQIEEEESKKIKEEEKREIRQYQARKKVVLIYI
jgi:hypothetical protein